MDNIDDHVNFGVSCIKNVVVQQEKSHVSNDKAYPSSS